METLEESVILIAAVQSSGNQLHQVVYVSNIGTEMRGRELCAEAPGIFQSKIKVMVPNNMKYQNLQ